MVNTIYCDHYATILEIARDYAARTTSVEQLVETATSEGFSHPWRWAGYYILSKSKIFNAYVEVVLRPYLSDAEIDAAVVRVAQDIEIWQR